MYTICQRVWNILPPLFNLQFNVIKIKNAFTPLHAMYKAVVSHI